MAIIATSPLISNLRGKAGSDIFYTAKGITYLRCRVKPINKQNPVTSNWRSIVSSFFKTWQQLSDDVRMQYNDIAPSIPHYDINGNDKPLSGYQLFLSCALNNFILNIGSISSYPDNIYVPILKNFRLNYLDPNYFWNWDDFDNIDNHFQFLLYQSMPTNMNSPKALKWVKIMQGNTSSLYLNTFDPFSNIPWSIVDMGPFYIWFKIKLINLNSFLGSSFQYCSISIGGL
jgi:hypothetical protein